MKVVKGDLTSMKASAAQVFETEVADANNIIKSLDEFISQVGAGTKLTGAAYEVIKSQLEEFKALMENRMTIATNMKSAIDSALSSMESYMEEYSELDTDELEEIEASISTAESSLSGAQSRLDDAGLTAGEKSDIQSTINYYTNLLIELRRKKEKLAGLGAADSSAWAGLANVSGDLSALSIGSSSV